MTTLVLGAGGFLGLNIVDGLVALGERPFCGRRARSNVIPLRSRKLPLVVADCDDEAGLTAAMRGVDVVVHAGGYYPKFSLDYDEALAKGARQLKTALDAAAAAGVRRFVYVSSTATVAPRDLGASSTEDDRFATCPRLSLYHDLKWTMEAVCLREDRFEVFVACPGACVGPWDLRVGTSALLVAMARGLDPPHPDGEVNLVDARDVGAMVARVALSQVALPKRLLMAAHNLRLHEMLTELTPRYGVPDLSRPLPADEARDLATREEERCSREGGRPPISREIVDLIVHGVPIDASLSERVLGITYRPWPDTLEAFDEWARRMRFIPERPTYGSARYASQPDPRV